MEGGCRGFYEKGLCGLRSLVSATQGGDGFRRYGLGVGVMWGEGVCSVFLVCDECDQPALCSSHLLPCHLYHNRL